MSPSFFLGRLATVLYFLVIFSKNQLLFYCLFSIDFYFHFLLFPFTISSLQLAWGLFCPFISVLMWKPRLLIWDLSFFLRQTLNLKFFFKHWFKGTPQFFYAAFTFSFSSKYFLNFLEISFLIHIIFNRNF